MTYERKTRDEYRLFVNYGQGWEHEISEDSLKDIRERAKEYNENCPEYPIRWSTHRVKKETV